jgi:hypothetical protein
MALISDRIVEYGHVADIERGLLTHMAGWLGADAAYRESLSDHDSELLQLVLAGQFAEAAQQAKRVAGLSRYVRQLVNELASLHSAARRKRPAVTKALESARELMPAALALAGTPDLASPYSTLASIGETGVDLLAVEDRASPVDGDRLTYMGSRTLHAARTQIWSIHNTALLTIAKGGQLDQVAESQIETVEDTVRTSMLGFRDDLLAVARQLNESPSSAEANLIAAIHRFETLLIDETVPNVAHAARGATRLLRDGTRTGLKPAGTAYGAFREGVTMLGAAYGLLTALATEDGAALRRWAQSADLPLKRPADLERTSIADAARGAASTTDDIEVAGTVVSAEFTVSNQRNTSVLRLEDDSANHLNLFVPHAAVDSFGIAADIWCEARGRLFPDGKDGIPGPVLLVGRENLTRDATASFTSFVHREGSVLFPYMRRGWQLRGGRCASTATTANEILFWMID